MRDTSVDAETRLGQFNRLIQELLRGTLNRNCFRPWEIEILLDIESCNLRDANRREILRRYQRAAQRDIDRGGQAILKLSEYLERNRRRTGAASQLPSVSGAA